MAIKVRPLESSDISPLMEMFKRLADKSPYHTMFWADPKDQFSRFPGILKQDLEDMKRKPRKGFSNVGFLGQKIVGACTISYLPAGLQGFVSVFVDPDHMRQKIGSTLLDDALKAAARDSVIEIIAEIHIANDDSLRFFLKNGFSFKVKSNIIAVDKKTRFLERVLIPPLHVLGVMDKWNRMCDEKEA